MPRVSIVTEHRLIRQTQSPERIADSTPSERLACWPWSRYDFVRNGDTALARSSRQPTALHNSDVGTECSRPTNRHPCNC
jgi:hypothetical protein